MASAGNPPMCPLAGVLTQTERFRIATIAGRRSSRTNRGRGPAIIMEDGARSITVAAGPGRQAEFGRVHGVPGVAAVTNLASASVGPRCRLKQDADGVLALAVGWTTPAVSVRIAIRSYISAILAESRTRVAAASTTIRVTAPSLLTPKTAPTSAIQSGALIAAVLILRSATNKSANSAAKNAATST